MMLLRSLVFLLLSLAPAQAYWQSRDSTYQNAGTTVYYVAAGGSDAANGLSPATAWQTVTKVNALLAAAAPSGTQILFNGGDTFSTTAAITITTTMTAGNITIGSYGAGQPVISSGTSAGCVLATNVPAVTINNLNCTGGGVATNTADGIHFVNSLTSTQLAGPTIINNTVSGYGLNGIEVEGNNGGGRGTLAAGISGFDNMVISGNTVHDVSGKITTFYGSCIQVFSPFGGYSKMNVMNNVTIQNNLAYNCTGTAAITPWSGSGIMFGEITTGLIQNNVVHDFATLGPGAVGIWGVDSNGVTIQFNEAYNGVTHTSDGGGFDLDVGMQNSIMQFNYAHDNQGPGYEVNCFVDGPVNTNTNNQFRFNIGQNDGVAQNQGEFRLYNAGGTFTNLSVYNNTFYNATTSTTLVNEGNTSAVSATFANNIFYGNGTQNIISVNTPSSIVFTGNDYFPSTVHFQYNGTNYASFSAWQTANPTVEKISSTNVGLTSNPQLQTPGGGWINGGNGYVPGSLTAYQLQSGSPMLPNAGLNLNTQYGLTVGTQDFFGAAITASTLPVGAAASVTSSFTAGCTAAATFLARVSSFSVAQNVNYNSLICGMVSDGDWAHTDALYMLAAPNSAASLLNLLSTSFSLTTTGTITFTANQGYAGNGTTGYLDTHLVPSTFGGLFSRNSGTLMAYVTTSRTTAASTIIIGSGTATGYSAIFPRKTTAAITAINDLNANTTPNFNTGNAQGLIVGQRTGSAAEIMYANGVSHSPQTGSSDVLSGFNMLIGAAGGPTIGSFSTDSVASALIGDGSISALRMSRRVNSFMQGLGINVY